MTRRGGAGSGELIVPVRSSGAGRIEPSGGVEIDLLRHGTDERGRFLAVYSDEASLRRFGPPSSDWMRLATAELLDLAAAAGERVMLDPGAPGARELELCVAPERPGLHAPGEVPQQLLRALVAALRELPQVERAWLVRRGEGWNAGIELAPSAVLKDFDEVRNRLHGVATTVLGTRRLLAVTDVAAPALREQFRELAAPFYQRRSGGWLRRLVGGRQNR